MSVPQDQAAFAQSLSTIVKDGSTTLGFYIGLQLGLFEEMVKFDNSFTPDELATRAKCKKAFIKDWLLQMAASDVLEVCDKDGDKFFLPPTRREFITSPCSAIMSRASFVVNLAKQADDLVECMKEGGPEKMENKMREMRRNERYKSISGQAPGLITQVPGLASKLESGISVLEVGSSRGELLLFLAKLYPKSTFTGVDPAKVDTDQAVQSAKDQGLDNVTFLLEDALNLPRDWTDKFDYVIAVNTLHHIADGVKGAQEMKRVLKPGGYLSVVEMRKDEDATENIKRQGAALFYVFNMASTAAGHRHDHHQHGHHHHGDHHHGHHHHGNKVAPSKDLSTGQGESTGGSHSKNTYQFLTQQLKQGGFAQVEMLEAPDADFLEQVHFLCAN